MRTIDIIRPSSLYAINGPISTLKRLIKNREFFLNNGYDITLFTNDSINGGEGYKQIPELNNMQSSSSVRKRISTIMRKWTRYSLIITLIMQYKSIREIKPLINHYISLKRTADIIQFHSPLECYLYLKKRKEHTAKIVMFLHTDGIPFRMLLEAFPKLNLPFIKRFMKKRFDWTIKHIQKIVFITNVGQKNFLQFYPHLHNTTVILNGIEDFTPEQEKTIECIKKEVNSHFSYRLCCCGTISYRKGHRFIIDALHQLPQEILSLIHIDFIGDGGERLILEKLVEKFGLKNNVKFHGSVRQEYVYEYLAKNNIYILMSKNEGLPMSIIEAMRMGLPIISTNVSGIPELVETNYNGILLNPSTEDLVNTFISLSKYDWTKMGNNSRDKFCKYFTFERMMTEFCEMYDNTLTL